MWWCSEAMHRSGEVFQHFLNRAANRDANLLEEDLEEGDGCSFILHHLQTATPPLSKTAGLHPGKPLHRFSVKHFSQRCVSGSFTFVFPVSLGTSTGGDESATGNTKSSWTLTFFETNVEHVATFCAQIMPRADASTNKLLVAQIHCTFPPIEKSALPLLAPLHVWVCQAATPNLPFFMARWMTCSLLMLLECVVVVEGLAAAQTV